VSVLKRYSTISGDNRGKEPPVYIPNTAVKIPIAENTSLVTKRKDRTLPDSIKENLKVLLFLYSKIAKA
jgi:hypothetical protein